MFQTKVLKFKFIVWLTEILIQSFVLYTEVFDTNNKIITGGNKHKNLAEYVGCQLFDPYIFATLDILNHAPCDLKYSLFRRLQRYRN